MTEPENTTGRENSFTKKWAELATIVACVINVVVVFYGIYVETYADYERKFWDEKMQTYVAIADITGKLTSCYKDDSKMKLLRSDFYSLYYGKTSIFGDKAVDNKMVEFRNSIEHFYPEDATEAKARYLSEVRAKSVELAKACREALKK